MPRERFSDLPTDASALACLVGDSSQTEEKRSYALEMLVPTIEAVAGQVATGCRRRFREDLVAESRTIIWLRVHQFNPSAGRFDDWCRTVLHNYAVDLWRKSNSGLVRPAAGGDESGAAMDLAVTVDTDQESEEAMERCRELRAALDRIAWAPSRGVYYFSVLLLQLRLAMARRLTQDQLNADAVWRSELPQFVEWLLPWRPDEDRACFKRNWPPLGQVWSAVREVICEPPSRIEAPVLCEVVGRWLPASSQLTPDVWNHWVHRAKREARDRVRDEVVWARCFSRLLPDR
ncbi:MAG: sigma-70 family RNA polymerase sigma factor [Rhodopirellula sp.]|nr:sigma-70 family RNA polymerase sigma factor [Rhodopirellula sp.]